MHLKPKPKLKFYLFILQATIQLSTFFCEKTSISYCAINSGDDDAFNCGSIVYLAYPFWGGNRTSGCGRQGFQIVCEAGVPMLNISSLSYIVREMDFNTNTLKVARQDLLVNTCPNVLLNTTLNLALFEYAPVSDNNLTLYYDCTDHDDRSSLPNKFRCSGKSDTSINLFRTGDDASSGPGSNITCNDNIFVPINKEAALSLQNPTASSINILKSALAAGFSVRWSRDELQGSPNYCNRNIYGSCIGPTSKIYTRSCEYKNVCRYSRDPEEPQGIGNPPVQSPGNSATGEGHNPIAQTGKDKGLAFFQGIPPAQSPRSSRQTGKGIPPAQSPGYFRQTGKGMPPKSSSYLPRTENGSDAGKNPGKEIVIVVTLSITGIITVTVAMCCFLKRRRRSATGANQECNEHVEKFLLQHGSLTPKRYKYSEIKKITKSFGDKLGKGGYGSVYKGVLPDGRLVAVKVLIEADSNGEEFINEVASISRTSHVNIVSLLGFCYDRDKRALVYEFMPNKSLDKFLNNNGSEDNVDCCLDLEKLYEIAVGIAKGLEYLHTGCTTRIVHFDIKPQNILLDEDFCPKISDFGLAKLCKKKQSILSVFGTRGTIGYIAPEVISRNFGGVSHKSDVYSYGMMVLEMAGAGKLVETEVIQSTENYFPDKIYEQLILNVTRKPLDDMMMEEEEEIKKKMFLVGFWCIQSNPSDRPSISKVVEMLEGNLQSIQIPPKPYLFAPILPEQEISSSFSAHVDTDNSAQN